MTPPPHRIERTGNRTSRAVLHGETVVIRLARGLSARQEQEHIAYLLKRMESCLRRERLRTPVDPFAEIFAGETDAIIPLRTGFPFAVCLRAGRTLKGQWKGARWLVTVSPQTKKPQLHRLLWKLLGTQELRRLERTVREIDAQTLNVGIRSVRLKYMATQWGSCSARGDITLNTALLLLPAHLLRYVVIHELAHRRVRSHSSRFWREVERGFPDCKHARKELGRYRLVRI